MAVNQEYIGAQQWFEAVIVPLVKKAGIATTGDAKIYLATLRQFLEAETTRRYKSGRKRYSDSLDAKRKRASRARAGQSSMTVSDGNNQAIVVDLDAFDYPQEQPDAPQLTAEDWGA